MDIIKAVIPAAGLGTRFLPFTKAVPKEMVPLLNKPAIQYIIEESIQSTLTNFLMISSRKKEAIAHHFDADQCLDMFLEERHNTETLKSLNRIIESAHFSYLRQSEPRGLGHAVWTARHMVNPKEYIAVLLPDDIIISKTPALSQLIKVAKQERASVIAIQEVPTDEVSSYGIINIKKQITPNLFQVSQIVEKPEKKDAPSNLAVVGRYILSQKIFTALQEGEVDERGELQLTDAISRMIHNNEKVFAVKIQGIRHDIGNPLGWVKAIIGCALQDPYYAPHINRLLKDQEILEHFIYNPINITENTL